ncbi:hypothetical protein [Paenibacillus qinlingensis]|uniref:Uncharacterized protein n=1 Tax=Paenibacillus qinlingensis TaxID=1837343 RepID=A0ABU1P0X9_9BACL|nr:hypothetical protein [Paenibacillus qinlingensis]MDR6552917.1 hypothetical protein [Paenibacillus qinlingensis]
MKIVGIFVIVLVFNIVFVIEMDILLGFSLYHSLDNMMNHFRAMSAPEHVLLIFMFVFLLIAPIKLMLNKTSKQEK